MKKKKKRKEINFIIYSISKSLRDQLLLVSLLGEGTDTIFTEYSGDQQATYS